MKKLIRSYRNHINPPYSASDFYAIGTTLVLLFGLAVTLSFLQRTQEIRQLAATNLTPGITFVNDLNQAVSQTTSPTVKVQLVSPWGPTAYAPHHPLFSLVHEALAQTQSATLITKQVASSSDDVNEDGSLYQAQLPSVFLGTGQSSSSSWTGMRFTNVTVPKGATVTSAKLQVFSPKEVWITMKFTIAGETIGNSPTFSSTNKPSQRLRTVQKVNHNSNTKWLATTWYPLEEMKNVIQEVVNRSDWQQGNSLSIIIKGNGGSWGRKFVTSFDGGANTAPKLVVSYTTGLIQPTTSSINPTVTSTSTPVPSTPTFTPTPTPVPTTVSVALAEDVAFTQNVQTVSYTTTPLIVTYTFSNTAPGTKTLFAKFKSSSGLEQVFSNSISLVSLSTPTPLPPTPTTAQTASPTPPPTSITGGNAASYGIWTPSKWDTCTKDQHDAYYVIGPDGKKYPTWHPPVDPVTGCKFGHEHGDDPSTAANWNEIKAHFAYNGDLTHAGLPFGYANEQLDAYYAAQGKTTMRHEDHVGHKVVVGNDVIVSNAAFASGTPGRDTGIHCNYLEKFHQGTHSKDATQNNLHEVQFFANCTDGQNLKLTSMGKFGKVGEFTLICDGPILKIPRDSTYITTGFTFSDSTYPGTRQDGARSMLNRECVVANILVPDGTFSGNAYEAWPVNVQIFRPDGSPLVDGINLLFDVEDGIRYYYPGQPNDIGYFMDLCYEVEPNGDRARGGPCSYGTNYGQTLGITWDDPRSPFKDLHRGAYFTPGNDYNGNGPTTWYTDPYGTNAQTTPFPGSIKQYIINRTVDIGKKLGIQLDPTVLDKEYNSGNGTVHAPN